MFLKKESIFVYLILALFFPLDDTFAQDLEEKTDYTSALPTYDFPITLEAQEEALKNNPMIQRFSKSRKKLSNDPYRPFYHFVNPEGNLNDPNGLAFWNGNWHLFYQAYPPEDPRQHWGHAISKDLVHWRDLPLAIYPGPERASYSGSALVEEDRVIVMYHGPRAGNMVAVSEDPLLLNWEKVTDEAVISLDDSTGFPLPYAVYDPNIWKKDGVYYSISGGRAKEGPAGKPIPKGYLFRSKDLEHWQYMHSFVEDDHFTMIGDDYACPYFWPIGDRYIMPFYSHMSGGQYLLGEYDKERDKFIASDHGHFNFGPSTPSGVHAPSATQLGDDVIVIFNMNPGYPTEGWNQIMTLPRRLSLTDDGEIRMKPAGDIESLRYDHSRIESRSLPANQEIVLEGIEGNVMEINAEIDPQNANMIELNVLRSPQKEEYTRIAIHPFRGYSSGRDYWRERGESPPSNKAPVRESVITLETSYSSTLAEAESRAPETAPFQLGEDENVNLRIFIDKSVVEVFVNEKQSVAARVYPGLEKSTGVSLRSQGNEAELISLDAWQMNNTWEISLDDWHEKQVWKGN
ncbi:glycoside hydrolase family 32 protein [Aliifodinibius sp. S!AR15-10]|uniref:glycoside hydrolase family 32 protein n=1 Tax=Aliifodinibius sp. S!AR15-10 TaxID=2950437 RepID=UPI002854D638|nr:glycoside hydrolase family 32 protein [Aliifodinibius sp. S!AR15-10]MDR8393411.1 glycoside hydrolase family 32 protein [Aliifodinibius sp. S!AR15-10]